MDGLAERRALGRAASSRTHQVRRGRLLSVLERTAPDVLVISAPVGYGKTTLVRQWLVTESRPVHWLEVHPTDSTDGRLGTRVAEAIDSGGRPCVLVLDGLHHLGVDAVAPLKELAAELPEGCTLVCIGCARPALSLGVLRARRRVLELDLQHLAFDAQEMGEVLRAAGVDVPAAHVDGLLRRTEGWPAAVQMAAAKAAVAADPALALDEFAGDDRGMVELLGSDVLGRLAAGSPAFDFLLAAAPLPRLCGALCDAALGRSGSAALLEQLATDTLLVVPLDDSRRWYRLHAALHAYLRNERRMRDAVAPDDVLRRASEWFEAEGDIDEAISHAAAGNDPDRATTLVMQHFSTRVGAGNPAAVQAWLRQIDDTSVTTNPVLQCVAALVRMGLGDADGAQRCLHRAEFGQADRYPQEAPLDQPAACVAALRAVLGRIDASAMRCDARYARRHTTSPMWFGVACLADGGSSFLLGDLDAAEEAWRASTAAAEPINSTTWVLALSCLALVHEQRGERARAGRHSRGAPTGHRAGARGGAAAVHGPPAQRVAGAAGRARRRGRRAGGGRPRSARTLPRPGAVGLAGGAPRAGPNRPPPRRPTRQGEVARRRRDDAARPARCGGGEG